MEVINKNVESKKNILGYLKNIEVNSSNIHEEIELDNYVVSIVMVITNSSTIISKEEEYIVYLLFQDNSDGKIYHKFFSEKFTNRNDADVYYTNLKNKVNSFTDKDILSIIQL